MYSTCGGDCLDALAVLLGLTRCCLDGVSWVYSRTVKDRNAFCLGLGYLGAFSKHLFRGLGIENMEFWPMCNVSTMVTWFCGHVSTLSKGEFDRFYHVSFMKHQS